MIHPRLYSKIKFLFEYRSPTKLITRTLPLIIGVLALIWFLIRVIPKPQRAGYPCMKAAYPLMTGLFTWILAIASFRYFIQKIKQKRYAIAMVSMLVLLSTSIILVSNSKLVLANRIQDSLPVHVLNSPFGEPKGIIPGRVVWAWNPDATNENCTNNLDEDDGYFLVKNNNQVVIDKMLSNSILQISGKKSSKKAWDAIFKHFNSHKGKGASTYKKTETIFIKINQGHANILLPDLTRKEGDKGVAETSPQIVISLLRELVNVAGVPQNKIIVADPLSHIYQYNYELFHKEFPDVIYGDRKKETLIYGRTLLTPDTVPAIYYSHNGTIEFRGKITTECLYKEMEDADYMINIASLKAHGCAGITMCGKNHFGSITRESAMHLHPGLVCKGYNKPFRVDYGMYRVVTDLMGSKYLGRNTMLFIIDGLWGGPEAVAEPVKWVMEPFNNDWPNSLLVSMDAVAIESVGFDFLRYEATVGSSEWNGRPNYGGADDYLHQAASLEFWPEGVIYDPDNSGKPMPSLGVHEHWNNPVDKMYSNNLGKSGGIELVRISGK